jgi:CheY-like chemotaxis protein
MFPISHLLLMEDDPDVASLYSQVLQDKGHTVTLACTAEECLKIYSESLLREQMKRTKAYKELMNRYFKL